MRPNTWQCKRFEWRSETSRPDNWQISVRPPETKICIEPREDQFTARQNQRLFGSGKISTRSWQIQNPTLYKKSTKQQISYLTVLSPLPPKKLKMKKGILQFYDLLQLVCLEAVEEEEQEEEDVGAPPAHHPAAWD